MTLPPEVLPIAPCPGCGHECKVMVYSRAERYQVVCESLAETGPTHRCGYEAPWGAHKEEAIRKHNLIAEGGPRGSSVCPICGIDTPHYHSEEEQAQYHQKIKSASMKQIEEAYPDIMIIPRRPLPKDRAREAARAKELVAAILERFGYAGEIRVEADQKQALFNLVSKHFAGQTAAPHRDLYAIAETALREYHCTYTVDDADPESGLALYDKLGKEELDLLIDFVGSALEDAPRAEAMHE